MSKQPKDEILELVNAALDAYNRKDAEAFKSIYSGDIVIVDGFAPFRWIGPVPRTDGGPMPRTGLRPAA